MTAQHLLCPRHRDGTASAPMTYRGVAAREILMRLASAGLD
ncbi:hypothetical protein [Mesorhizobium sp. M0518]